MEEIMEQKTIHKKVWGLLTVIWISIALNSLITFSYGMVRGSVMEKFSLSFTQFGQIGLVGGIICTIITVPIALYATKINLKLAVPAAIGLVAVGMIIFGTAQNVTSLFVGKALIASFAYAITTTVAAFKAQQIPIDQITKVNSYEMFIGPLGQVAATTFVTYILLLVGGWENLHVIAGIVMLVAAVTFFILWKDGSGLAHNQQFVAEDEVSSLDALKKAFKEKAFWLLALGWGPGTSFIWLGMFGYWPALAQQTLGFTPAQTGMVLGMIPIFSAIGSITAPAIVKKIGVDKPIIVGCGFILPVLYFLMVQSSNLIILCILAAMAGYLAYLFVPAAMGTAFKLGHSKRVVSVGVGMLYAGIGLAGALSSGVIGFLIDTLGGDVRLALSISSCSPFLFGILMIFLPERGRKWMEKQQANK